MADAEKPKSDSDEPSSSPPTGDKPSWIEGLAKRSTGLPPDPTERAENGTSKGGRTPWSYAGLGLQFAGTIALFTFMGFELDQKMGWTPWGMVSLAMVSVIGSFYLLIKEAMQDEKKQERRK